MPTLTRRELILEAFFAQLETINTDPAGSGVTVEVMRNARDAIASTPAVVMVDGGMEKNTPDIGGEIISEDRYLQRVQVWGYESDDDAPTLGGKLSDLYGRVVKVMLADVTLGGVAEYLRESASNMDDPEFDKEKGHKANVAFVVHFETEFITKQGDPFSLPGT